MNKNMPFKNKKLGVHRTQFLTFLNLMQQIILTLKHGEDFFFFTNINILNTEHKINRNII